LFKARPELVSSAELSTVKILPVVAGIFAVALFIGAIVSNFASTVPDGLETSLAKSEVSTQKTTIPDDKSEQIATS